MRLIILITFLALLSGTGTFGQSGWTYHSLNYAGIGEGKEGTSFQLSTLHGIKQKHFFLGLGTGLDYYKIRSIPLMVNFTGFLSNKPRSFYLSAEGGTHFAWGKTPDIYYYYDLQSEKFKPRFGGSFSFGYKIGLRNNKDALLLNAGLGYKHIRSEVKYGTICNFGNCTIREQYDYKLMLLLVRVGWMF